MLFLCAILSALGGAITGARAPAVEVRMAQVADRAQVAQASATRSVAAVIRTQGIPDIAALLSAPCARAFALSVPPIFASRLRI